MIDSPFPTSRIETNHPTEIALIHALYDATTGLIGRGYISALRPLRPWLEGKEARLIFSDGSQFCFPISDPYWNRLAAPRFRYEPEIAHVLQRAKAIDYTFIDAGANFGFWSVVASAPAFGSKKTLAIEASAETLLVLEHNCLANGRRFEIRHNAVFGEDDVSLGFTDGHHSVRQVTREAGSESVRSITLDTAAAQAGVDPGAPVIIKLDVEGAEIPALAGAARLLEGDALLIYEDHGNDAAHGVTRHVLGERLLDVTYVDASGRMSPISAPDQLSSIKKNRYTGYNFVACKPGTLFHNLLGLKGR